MNVRPHVARRVAALLLIAATHGRAQAPQSLTLGDAARLAARQSILVLGAKARADQADARTTQRRADLLPNVSASFLQSGRTINSATFGISFPAPAGEQPFLDPRGEIIGPVNTGDFRARVSQTVVDFAATARLRSARAAADASDADVTVAGEQAAAAAATIYVRALRAQAEVVARAADSLLVDDLLRIAREQLAGGIGVALDATRAEAQLLSVHTQLIAARAQRDRTRLELLRALGLPFDTPLSLSDSLAVPDDAAQLPVERAAIDDALAARADLRAEDARLTAVDHVLRATRAERLPTLTAFGDGGVIGKNYNRLLGTYDWGIQVTVPVFEGFRREGRISEGEAQRREIELQRQDLRQQVAIDVRIALLDLTAAREQAVAARARLALAEQEVAQSRDRFTAGVTGNAEVITASLALNAARTLVLDALTAYDTARVALARAQGHLTTLP